MQYRDLIAEHATHASNGLRSERDLGDEQNRSPPRRDDATQDVEIDERLARPGDAMNQRRLVGVENPLHDTPLVRGEGRWWRGRQPGKGIARFGDALDPGKSLLHESVEHGAR